MNYIVLADIVLILHFLFVLFNVIGILLIWIGKYMNWQWVHYLWFRAVHFASILLVVFLALLDISCPLTVLEKNLRLLGGEGFYIQSFIQFWIYKILFYNAPEEIFIIIYIIFSMLVAGTFIFVPIDFSKRKENH